MIIPPAVICDLDGTLALFGNANPYDRNFTKDELSAAVSQVLRWMNKAEEALEQKTALILVSGRRETARKQTEQWLAQNNIQYTALFMRPANDNRRDTEVKREIYERQIKGKYEVLFVLDDRNQVVEMWRQEGLVCLQVAEGNF